jgi:hypothetical protein
LLSALVFTNHAFAAEYKGITLPDQYEIIYFGEEPIESLKEGMPGGLI